MMCLSVITNKKNLTAANCCGTTGIKRVKAMLLWESNLPCVGYNHTTTPVTAFYSLLNTNAVSQREKFASLERVLNGRVFENR